MGASPRARMESRSPGVGSSEGGQPCCGAQIRLCAAAEAWCDAHKMVGQGGLGKGQMVEVCTYSYVGTRGLQSNPTRDYLSVMVMRNGVDEMTSVLEAIVSTPASGVYRVKFMYMFPNGTQDYSKPSWEIPANSWVHAKRIVGAFNDK